MVVSMSPAQQFIDRLLDLLKRLINGPVPEYVPVRSNRRR